jgi:Flp pilus assembly protein TadD/Zn-dependent protease with chaperone function
MPPVTPLPPPSHDPSPWRALAFAALGYAYIALVTGAMLALVVAGWRYDLGALVFIPAGLLFSIVAALWLSNPVPPGIPLAREQAPALFRAMDRVRGRLRAPEADVVLLTEELNAAVLERPRLGIPWWPRRYLMVGLPLLHALPADEVEAILAHEFAHLSRDHNRVQRWLVRALDAWITLGVGLRATRSWGALFFTPFIRGYVPRLERLAQAASRAHELESDRLAARVVGPEVAGRALLRLRASTHRLENEVLPALLADSWTLESPPADLFGRLLRALVQPPREDARDALLRTVLAEHTLHGDSHPSLSERLRSLGQSPSAAALARDAAPAAETLLGPSFPPEHAATVGEVWGKLVEPLWAQAHADARVCRHAEAAAGAAGAGDGAAARDARWARARWAAQCEPPAEAVPLLRAVLAEVPRHHEAAVTLATLLVAGDDADAVEEGLRLLEREADRDSVSALTAVGVLQRQYARLGREAGLRRAQRREEELRQASFRRVGEQAVLEAGDTLRPYPLAGATREALVRALERHPEVTEAFLVEKRAKHLGGTPMLVLAVHLHAPWFRPSWGPRAMKVCQALVAEFHVHEAADRLVAPVDRRTALLRRLRALPGATLYRREGGVPAAPAVAEWSAPSRLGRVAWSRWLVGGAVALVIAGGVLAAVTDEDGGVDTRAKAVRKLPALRAEARDHPDDGDAQAALAWALLRAGRTAEARPVVERAAALNPSDSRLQNALGWVLSVEDRFAESVPPLRRAIALDPGFAEARHNLGRSLYRLGRFAEAEHAFRSALRLRPGAAALHTALGSVLVEQRRLAEAEQSFARAVELDSTWIEGLGGVAITQLQQGRISDAVASYRRAVAIIPGEPLLWAELGHALHLAGDYGASAAAFDRVEQLDPGYFARDSYRAGMRAASRAGHAYQAPEP